MFYFYKYKMIELLDQNSIPAITHSVKWGPTQIFVLSSF